MTDRKSLGFSAADSALERWVAQALAEQHDLAPITESEVRDAEADGLVFEGELPDALIAFSPSKDRANSPSAKVVSLGLPRQISLRRAWIGHSVAAVVGAAAATAIVLSQVERRPQLIALGRDPDRTATEPSASQSGLSATGAINEEQSSCAASCCAGAECNAAKGALRECPSQRSCIRCNAGTYDGRYRLRIGRLAPSATGKFLLDKSPGRTLETCVRVAGSRLSCVNAYAGADDEEAWVLLPLTATPADLLAGITVQLRFVGEEDPMAEWSYPVESSAAVLCNGLAVKLKLPDGESVGSLSMFLDDAYYVELGRGKSPGELTPRLSTIQFRGASPNLFETDAVEGNRYALSIGPLDKATAEAAKWSVLRQGGDAKIVLGFDYRSRAPRANPE